MKLSKISLGLTVLLLSACTAPNYSEPVAPTEIVEGTEILTINGYVVEVTEDNVIRVSVPRKGDYIEDGLKINKDGVMEVALAAVQLPTQDMPLGDVTNEATATLLEGQDITVEIAQEELTGADELIEGYIYLGEESKRIQDVLLENGMAIVDKASPYYEIYSKELERFETAAKNDQLGVWAFEGFITLSNEFDETFTTIGQDLEKQADMIQQKMKENGWTLLEQIEKIGD